MHNYFEATNDYSEAIARILVQDGAGVVEILLGGLILGMKPKTLLSAGFLRGEGVYDCRNVILGEEAGEIRALLFAYPAAEHKIHPMLETFIPAGRLSPIRPILEQAVPGSLYVQSLWVPDFDADTPAADALLFRAGARAAAEGLRGLSMFCWNDNAKSLGYLQKRGFTPYLDFAPATLPVPGHELGGVLLFKDPA